MKRFGSVIEVRKDKLDEYVKLHADVWPGVLDRIKKCHIQNYSIYLRKMPDGKLYLFSYFELSAATSYADMAKWPPSDYAEMVGRLQTLPPTPARP